MKRIISVLMSLLVVLSFAGCSKEENKETANEVTQAEPAEEVKELTPEEIEALKEEDINAMLTIMVDAENVNSKIGDAVKAYNNRSADEEKTLETLKTLQAEFETVKESFKSTTWKSDECSEYLKQLKTALDGLDEFFVLVIEGFEEEDYDKQDNAFKSRQIYIDESYALYQKISEE